MSGGTTFRFVTDGITSAMAQARAAAGSGNISIAGGATTINEHLAAGLIDELRLHVVPFTAGVSSGSRIFAGRERNGNGASRSPPDTPFMPGGASTTSFGSGG